MKILKKKQRAFVAIIACFMLFACSSNTSDDEMDDNNNEGNNNTVLVDQDLYVYCKVDGTEFISKDDILFSFIRLFDVAGRKTYQLGGGDGKFGVNLQFNNAYDGLKTYNIADFDKSNNIGCTYLINGQKTYAAGYGTDPEKTGKGWIKVTAFDGEYMEGTFEFTAIAPDWSDRENPDYSDKVEVTEGKFRLKLK